MSMDKSWMSLKNRLSPGYIKGVENFLEFAFSHSKSKDGRIKCPCVDCNNTLRQVRADVLQHLLMRGIVTNYTIWRCHGESTLVTADDEMDIGDNEDAVDDDIDDEMLDDLQDLVKDIYGNMGNNQVDSDPEDPNANAAKFFQLLNEAQEPLYPGCTAFSRLSFIIKLLHLKSMNKWTNTSFTELLKVLKQAFPLVEDLPSSYYECQAYIKSFGLSYEKIDACEHDCILYYKEYKDLEQCPVCQLSRWKGPVSEDGSQRRIPRKVLRYFPLIPRLLRLFLNGETAENMVWHMEKRVNEKDMSHPSHSKAWEQFDRDHPEFSEEPRNVRLGLASDGFSPFGDMSNPYSTWPVVVTPYNLPPWLCMKEPYFFLTLLIPGPKAPGNDIDVYLRPLIDELKQLWDGVDAYDASKKQNFKLKAAVLWTINDFPAYGNLSGYGTKGKMACPCCHVNTSSLRLKYGRKSCYMGHRRFLRKGHRWRANYMVTPKPMSGRDALKYLNTLGPFTFGKFAKCRFPGYLKKHNWRKKSIFFELPYWKDLLLRHNLDVMHIEKNVFENLTGTILGIKGKAKDSENIRKDLKLLGIRKKLWLKQVQGKLVMPPAEYLMKPDARKLFFEWLKALKCPDSYSSNISRCVKDGKLSGLKSHDCHILLEQFLPIALPELLPKNVSDALVDLCVFFRDLCRRTLNLDELDRMEENIAITLCKLERIFLPSFFDIMVHLSVHLAAEARIAGPVQYRWMYPIERYF